MMSDPSPATSTPVRARIGFVSGGLGAYWAQFPELRPQLEESARTVRERIGGSQVELVDVGFVSDAAEAAAAGDALRRHDCDLVVFFAATYLTSSMVLPVPQRSQAPVLVVDLQPTPALDHATADTGAWLAYCGQCPVPEIGNVFRRSGIDFRSVSGHLHDENAWARIDRWIAAAIARAAVRRARLGLMGHLYPGMLDVSTDMTLISAQFGSHVEVLEFDDLRVRTQAVADVEVRDRVRQARETFDLDETVRPEDLEWAARVSVGLDRLIDDFGLDALAYYHRGLDGELHERLAAGMILGASLTTARGVPAAGEYELRTSVAQLVARAVADGGSFTEIQALNFADRVVEMGHDGPADLSLTDRRPLLRGLGVYHGKRGRGVSVELTVRAGPVTCFGVGQDRDGTLTFVVSEGEVVDGPMLRIGNTTSRVAFGGDPGEWVDAWSGTGVGHHWALMPGHHRARLAAAADLTGRPFRAV